MRNHRPGSPREIRNDKAGGQRRFMKNYKLKTHKATAKRVRVTGGGKYMHLKAARTKYRRKKDPNRNRSLSKPSVMAVGDAHKMKRLLPYG
jgi:large subunit ribosomal protein L35